VTVTFSQRLRHTLGKCTPVRGKIVLSAALRSAPTSQLAPVLCHEAAHVAAFLLYGGAIAPHGKEWAALVRAVGHTPSMSLLHRSTHTLQLPATHRGAFRFEHRCPVCQSVRWAARRVSGWRCAECRSAGLIGVMEIVDRERSVLHP
jgi:predicted SprT family Zn-dependent metalloprotease